LHFVALFDELRRFASTIVQGKFKVQAIHLKEHWQDASATQRRRASVIRLNTNRAGFPSQLVRDWRGVRQASR
jgi:hypothetical protein